MNADSKNSFALLATKLCIPPMRDDWVQRSRFHAGLTFLLEHLPRNVHVMITSRADPPLPLPRLRARRQLTELRAHDWRISGKILTAPKLNSHNTFGQPDNVKIVDFKSDVKTSHA